MSITIPPAALEAAVNAYAGAIWDADARPIDYRRAMTAAIAAALNAWPGMYLLNLLGGQRLALPLPQEASDAE